MLRFFFLVLFLYAAVIAGYTLNQRKLLYHPSATASSLTAAKANPRFHEISVQTEDGLHLKGWYAPATKRGQTILFFHGNADDLASSAPLAEPYIAAGYGFLIAEYRGYGGQEGTPTEEGLYADGRAFLRALQDSGIRSEKVVLFGHSLGTGVAVELATHASVAGLILLAPFTSIADAAKTRYPFLPVDYMIRDRYDNLEKIRNIHAPLLVAHGAKDDVVPLAEGQKLYAEALDPKLFYVFPFAGHSDLFSHGFGDVSLAWLRQIGQTRTPY